MARKQQKTTQTADDKKEVCLYSKLHCNAKHLTECEYFVNVIFMTSAAHFLCCRCHLARSTSLLVALF